MLETATDPKTIERLLREGAIPVTRAAALAPSCRGKGRSAATLVRWIEVGKRGVHLEGYYGADKCWFTSMPALARFFARLTDMRLAGRGFVPTSARADDADMARRRKRAAAATEARRRLGS